MGLRTPYEAHFGDNLADFHPAVQLAHSAPLRARGTVDIEHGPFPRLIRLLNLPPEGKQLPATLEVQMAKPNQMIWRRDLGGVIITTVQFERDGQLCERHGLATIAFNLTEHKGDMRYDQANLRVLGVAWSAPHVKAEVRPFEDGWQAEVDIQWRGKMLCHYIATMRAE